MVGALNSAALLFPMAELLYFGVLVAAGLAYRHRPEIHKRLMLLATVGLATEPILHLVKNQLPCETDNLDRVSRAVHRHLTGLVEAVN